MVLVVVTRSFKMESSGRSNYRSVKFVTLGIELNNATRCLTLKSVKPEVTPFLTRNLGDTHSGGSRNYSASGPHY